MTHDDPHDTQGESGGKDGGGARYPAPGVSSPPEAQPDPDATKPPRPGPIPTDLPDPLTLPQHDGEDDTAG
ncbi:hypothetical protein HNW77_03830 [Komagataeibacter sp. AV436]|uniref:Uncharacterized protein n=1 Tax=Komagataeibacter melomenusus TaxID=2766578 RepID=A0ABX2AB14_9PROT|nr:hypothetical protein [Komagataeibacter melomenusus]MBV1830147.1 hypothetical protein [Komagataeibacter melomenusus]NPC65546.1 hypothetical protein [Komagataeibacter melomenusus]